VVADGNKVGRAKLHLSAPVQATESVREREASAYPQLSPRAAKRARVTEAEKIAIRNAQRLKEVDALIAHSRGPLYTRRHGHSRAALMAALDLEKPATDDFAPSKHNLRKALEEVDIAYPELKRSAKAAEARINHDHLLERAASSFRDAEIEAIRTNAAVARHQDILANQEAVLTGKFARLAAALDRNLRAPVELGAVMPGLRLVAGADVAGMSLLQTQSTAQSTAKANTKQEEEFSLFDAELERRVRSADTFAARPMRGGVHGNARAPSAHSELAPSGALSYTYGGRPRGAPQEQPLRSFPDDSVLLSTEESVAMPDFLRA